MMTEQVSLMTQIASIVQHRQFYWWLGHIFVVCNGLIYFSSILSLNTNPAYYKRAYLGALLSHAVVIYNSVVTNDAALSVSILSDENVHYFVIAFYWYSYQPIAVTLLPFFIFSIFHTLSYFRSTILPIIPANAQTEKVNTKIRHFTSTHHATAMHYVAYIEVVVILGRIIVGMLIFRTSVLALIIFIHFLRLRYYLSSYTKDAILNTTVHLDKWLLLPDQTSPSASLESPKKLTVVSNIYLSVKRLVMRYAGVAPVASK
ncbi:uncharacterized protein ATC70_002274 [Mucor velutinosus]|uniref:Pore membrane protein of 33 kDa n=1 Tax=Mucor velutinosus TaxID=708070 RepID=A0AAN7HZC2_9FUNG|nr:hypothetical protein ATC70_002274 [Mucor velutinosus]